jgi:hypothetical protein
MNSSVLVNVSHNVHDLDEIPMQALTILSMVLTIVNIVLGLPGNILTVVAILRNNTLRTAFNIMVVALACFDLYVIIGALPIHLKGVICGYPPGDIACHIQIFITIQSLVASHLFIPTIAFIRLHTVRRRTPSKLTKAVSLKCVAVCTTLSFVVAIWYIVHAHELSYRIACTQLQQPFQRTKDEQFENLIRIFIAMSTSVLGFCVVTYTLLCCHVRKTKRSSAVHPPPGRQTNQTFPVPRGNIRISHHSQRTLVTLNGIYIILLLFSTFYVGTFVFALIYMRQKEDRESMDVHHRIATGKAFANVAKSMVYLHSSFNWIVYMATSQKYRQIVVRMIKPRHVTSRN